MTNQNEAKKIFVSYKYKDKYVQPLTEYTPTEDTDFFYTPRHYVDKIIEVVGADHIYKGEKGDESIGHLADDTIDSKLKEKIFDSSVTIVLMSPNMWDQSLPEKEQWIPNEITYSLRYKMRGDRASDTNAMLAVVLPDLNGSFDYAVSDKGCVITWHTNRYFKILKKNMFNRKNKNQKLCDTCGNTHHFGSDHSYIRPVKWDDFIKNHNFYINHALGLKDRLVEFDLTKTHD